MTDSEKKVVAYHEIGHALVAAMQTESAPVQKITIIPRTSGALGYTMQVEQNDKVLMSRQELENKIATFAGGRAAGRRLFSVKSQRSANDIEQATKLARAMITRYGMSDDFDMVAMETVNNKYLGGDTSLECAEETQREIDEKVVELVKPSTKRQGRFYRKTAASLMSWQRFCTKKKLLRAKNLWKFLINSIKKGRFGSLFLWIKY